MIETGRVIIVGAGLGAICAALELAPRPVLVISPELLGAGASSAWAQGGVAAALSEGDSPAAHAADTIKAGAGTVDQVVADIVTADARAQIEELSDLGTPFDRDAFGRYIMNREAAHSMARVVRVKGDQAGRKIMETLVAAAHATPSIQVLERVIATGLESDGEKVTGVFIAANRNGGSASVLVRGPAVLLAGGGSGGLFAHTTNPPNIRGQVIGMAARAGAVIGDPEFVQFHPTALDTGEDPAPLATEALRGEGATLINKFGERFMLDVHPDAELAPRDIVARAIFRQAQAGNRPMLDTREVLGEKLLTKFPVVAEACRRAGIDPVKDAIPIAVAAHYHMGGVDADLNGKTSLDCLWVCGEASCTGLHGANRLASNGLLEALVFARRAARDIMGNLPAYKADETGGEVAPEFGTATREFPEALVTNLRNLMTDEVGVLRNGAGLSAALGEIAALEAQSDDENFLNMTATATLIAAAALRRTESRGAHYREDFPEADPEQARPTEMTLAEALIIRAAAAGTKT